MKSIRRRDIRILAIVIASLVIAGAKLVTGINASRDVSEYFRVQRVVDGDTLELSGGERVRLIGIDTPEKYPSDKLTRDARRSRTDERTIQALGKKSSDFTNKICGGRNVRLEYDVEKRDRYSRILAYVYLDDGTFVNARIIEEGYARATTIPPNVRYADLFRTLEQKARNANRGLWSSGY